MKHYKSTTSHDKKKSLPKYNFKTTVIKVLHCKPPNYLLQEIH